MKITEKELVLIIILFMIYSFAGWIIELIYRSIEQRRFINPGFLSGPFLPIYGFAMILLLLPELLFGEIPFYINIIFFGIITSSVEYFTGMFLEKGFGMKLWDYSKDRFNLHGRISLKYTVIWILLVTFFIYFVHPLLLKLIIEVSSQILFYLALFSTFYIFLDFIISLVTMNSFRAKFSYLIDNYLKLESLEIDSILASMKRFLHSFPQLQHVLHEKLDINIKNKINIKLSEFKNELDKHLIGKIPFEEEYESIVKDILSHEEFLKLDNYLHHNSSILDHVKTVSYLAYKIAKYLGIDYCSAARGGLLHDFFLYDWRKDEGRPYKNKLHGFEHPKIALENAKKYFHLNNIEEDIIIKHMWPLTPIPPKYKESYVVTFVDKYIASKEFVAGLKMKISNFKESRQGIH